MVRTQVYLTKEQERGLKRLAEATGCKQSELIREAIDAYLATQRPRDWRTALEPMFGMWADRPEMDDYVRKLRNEVEAEIARRWDTVKS